MNSNYVRSYNTTKQTVGNKREESRFCLHIKEKGELISILPQEGFYQIFFLLEGACEMREETGNTFPLLEGEFILLPADQKIRIYIKENISLLVLNCCDPLLALERTTQEDFSNHELQAFNLSSTMEVYCRFILLICKEKRMPKEWEELKKRELVLLLKQDYTNRQLRDLFRPVALDKSGFRQKVKQDILQTSSITELHTLSGMKRTTFEKRFRKEFGNSPYKWILQKKSIEVKQSLSDPSLSLEEVRRKHGFNSASHFVRFCRKQLGMAPSALRKELKTSINSTNEIW